MLHFKSSLWSRAFPHDQRWTGKARSKKRNARGGQGTGSLLFLEHACVSTILHCLISRASQSFCLFCESSAVRFRATGHNVIIHGEWPNLRLTLEGSVNHAFSCGCRGAAQAQPTPLVGARSARCASCTDSGLDREPETCCFSGKLF